MPVLGITIHRCLGPTGSSRCFGGWFLSLHTPPQGKAGAPNCLPAGLALGAATRSSAGLAEAWALGLKVCVSDSEAGQRLLWGHLLLDPGPELGRYRSSSHCQH